MSDMPAFERQLERRIHRFVGPARPVDDLAVFDAVVAASRSRTWGFTMFSALKFATASIILALVGGVLLAGILAAPQGDEVAPATVPEPATTAAPLDVAYFDGTVPYPGQYLHGTTEAEGVKLLKRGDGWEFRDVELSDPRLNGTWRTIMNRDSYVAAGGVWTTARRVDNEAGYWLGHFTGYATPDGRWLHQGTLSGAGAYDGLTAIVFMEDNGADVNNAGTYRIHGMTFRGELPDAPEFPQPAE